MNAERAEYLLVGGYALAVHAVPRFTWGLDMWVHPTEENASRVRAALERFGAPLGGLSPGDLATPGIAFQIGVQPKRIDALTAVDGVAFEEAWPERVETRYGDAEGRVIGRRQLILNKRASGRPQDLVDADLLERE